MTRNDSDTQTLLKALTEAVGISGQEDEVRQLIIDIIEDDVDEWRVDTMGNILAFKKGTGQQNMKIMVAAHMDEVGFMVMGHDSDGNLIVDKVGGVDDKLLPAMRVQVGEKKLPGVFLWQPVHLNKNQLITPISKMRVDIGVNSKDKAKEKAPPGTRVAFVNDYTELSDTVVRAKAFDDRVGCAELIELCLGAPFPFDLYAVFTVQEEVGLRGAQVISESIQPDMALILEVTACHETPQDEDEPDVTTVTKMGQGPAITYMDRTTIAHPGLLRHFVETAEQEGIPHQFRSPQYAGGTDAGSIHKSGAGIPSLGISVPGRYLHSPNIIISLEDYQNALRLVRAAFAWLTPAALKRD